MSKYSVTEEIAGLERQVRLATDEIMERRAYASELEAQLAAAESAHKNLQDNIESALAKANAPFPAYPDNSEDELLVERIDLLRCVMEGMQTAMQAAESRAEKAEAEKEIVLNHAISILMVRCERDHSDMSAEDFMALEPKCFVCMGMRAEKAERELAEANKNIVLLTGHVAREVDRRVTAESELAEARKLIGEAVRTIRQQPPFTPVQEIITRLEAASKGEGNDNT